VGMGVEGKNKGCVLSLAGSSWEDGFSSAAGQVVRFV
jgi:hypothetical protein